MPLTVRLIRRVDAPAGRGPGNGMFALQRALNAAAPAWLKIGGAWSPGEIPWFWSWEDRTATAACADLAIPFVTGPNQLFADSSAPCRTAAEKTIVRAGACRLIFTESEWYARLIDQHRGPANRAPIVIWRYPIEPRPGGPLPAQYDVLVYAKSGYSPGLTARLRRRWPRTRLLEYGRHRRSELFEAARRSRACVYCSLDDRGPLALAEILLAGCPAVGVERGAPWIVPGQTGYKVAQLDPPIAARAVEQCHSLDRSAVRAAAERMFDTRQTVSTIIASLRQLAGGG